MGKYIELEFVDQKIKARARLLEEKMPRTCKVAMLLSTEIKTGREKATCAVQTGDIAYVWLNRDDHYGLEDDVSEICWFYDRDSTPAMAEGPVRVNVFASIEGNAEAFYKASADTRITGVKRVRISLIEE
ncbi:MAG: hypothetical protein AMS23_10895 [Bacteroides sp. SM1_62]|nr:MAG: hypothetical protein AMS23_10895 [Bacteroides sp. SM1_62]